MKIKTALTVAGSDCSGDAGIQADIKTMTMNGVYAMSAITALTAQNTTGRIKHIRSNTRFSLKPDGYDIYRHSSRCDQNRYGREYRKSCVNKSFPDKI